MPKMAEQRAWDEDEHGADDGRDAETDLRRDLHTLDRALRVAGAEVLTRDRRRRAHQPDRRPRDQREQLGVADRVRRLRGGALLAAIR